MRCRVKMSRWVALGSGSLVSPVLVPAYPPKVLDSVQVARRQNTIPILVFGETSPPRMRWLAYLGGEQDGQ